MIATKFEKKEIRPNSAIFAFAVVVVKTRIVETRLHVKRGTKRVGLEQVTFPDEICFDLFGVERAN